ncbi:hypothetical protein Dsin_029900 [Dipteronia sinensis]|uniref:Cupin type-1 domain-containing protein n=1 Tax=Dipteronia sinensis TaxID=43782 RepID=A0AAD9ZTN1_9ROSI|nr:hypothetical protein Dsin_029900 [Dipteronia sinensis]
MATYSCLLSVTLSFLVLFSSCSAQISQVTSRGRQQRIQTQCNIKNLDTLEPQQRIESEAGHTDLWDQNSEDLQCANVAVLRHTIQNRGLLVPSYTGTTQMMYVLQGEGLHGASIPGCPETFQYSQQQSKSQSQSQSQSQEGREDEHQKVRQIREGDVIALPAGIAHWIYNNGQSNLVVVSLYDIGNDANQLDQSFRNFFLGGSPQQELQGESRQEGRQQGRQQGQQGRQQGQQGQEQSGGNVYSGFNQDLLAEALNIDRELVNKLQKNDRQRGVIVRVQDEFQVVAPHRREQQESEQEQEREQEQGSNGLEETLCTLSLKHNINKPSLADVFNPRAGRSTSINAYVLPILENLQLSINKVVLYKNAIYAPHWNPDAHSILYIIRGSGRIQIVSQTGDAVFDDNVKEGQVVVVPQEFAVVQKAGNSGLEWISFKTHPLAKISQLAGRRSFLTSTPVDVLANAFRVSREDARRLKNGRREITLFITGNKLFSVSSMEDQASVNFSWLSRWLGLEVDDSTDFLSVGVEKEKVYSYLENEPLLALQISDRNEVGEGTGGKSLSNHSSFKGRDVSSLGEVILGHVDQNQIRDASSDLNSKFQFIGKSGTNAKLVLEKKNMGCGSGNEGREDEHQKVRQIREGDVIALPAGIAHWIYNNGQSNLVVVSLYDLGNDDNQLDQSFRNFFLGGSPQQELQGESRQEGRQQGQQGRQQGQQGQEQSGGNVYSGFNQDLLAEALNIDRELVNKLQRNDRQRGVIVRVQDEFQVVAPHRREEQEREQEQGSNGLEETLCTLSLKHNINKPSLADVFNPRAGRSTSINAYVLPILENLQLSINKVVLYKMAYIHHI